MLPRPFDGQITQARDPQPVRQMPIDCGFDEIGSKESQRYRHVDFAHAALGAGGDALGRGRRILDQLLEPTAPLGNRSNPFVSDRMGRASTSPALERFS